LITPQRQHGAVILVMVFILLGAISLLILYVVNSGIIGGRVIANEYQTQQAFEAVAAGIDYGVVYLQQNNSSILVDSDSDGFIDANSFTQTLNNNSTFTVSFTNPVANDFNLIKITATGTSTDGNASKQMTELVKFTSYAVYLAPSPLVVRGEVEVKGSAVVRNLTSPTTIWSGDNISFQGSGHTESNDGSGSSASYTHTDVIPNSSALSNLSDDAFFSNFFGATKSEIKSMATTYYQNDGSRGYNSELNGKEGELIWIDQTSGDASITSNTQIGTAANPVILVVDGNFKLSGTPVIYGIVFVTGTFSTSIIGNVQVFGSVITNGSMSLSGSAEVVHNEAVFNKVQSSLGEFAIVPGSWKDY